MQTLPTWAFWKCGSHFRGIARKNLSCTPPECFSQSTSSTARCRQFSSKRKCQITRWNTLFLITNLHFNDAEHFNLQTRQRDSLCRNKNLFEFRFNQGAFSDALFHFSNVLACVAVIRIAFFEKLRWNTTVRSLHRHYLRRDSNV